MVLLYKDSNKILQNLIILSLLIFSTLLRSSVRVFRERGSIHNEKRSWTTNIVYTNEVIEDVDEASVARSWTFRGIYVPENCEKKLSPVHSTYDLCRTAGRMLTMKLGGSKLSGLPPANPK